MDRYSYTQIISEYDDHCSDLAEGIFKYMCNKVKECEYILFSEFKENCVRLLPNGYKSTYSGTIDEKLKENGVYQIHNSDAFANKLREIGIDVGKRHIIVNKQMYEKIKSIGYDK